MRHILIHLTAALLAAAVLSPAVAAKADKDALANDVLARNDRVIQQLAKAEKTGNLNIDTSLAIIRQEMSPILNFQKITRRAMGKYWKKASKSEKQQITAAFQKLLEATYADVLTKYKNQTVRKVGVKDLAKGDVSVLVEVQGNKQVLIDYIFSDTKNGDYLISDIKVEKISLVGNYRRQFKQLISAGGVAGLLAKLEQIAQKKLQ